MYNCLTYNILFFCLYFKGYWLFMKKLSGTVIIKFKGGARTLLIPKKLTSNHNRNIPKTPLCSILIEFTCFGADGKMDLNSPLYTFEK